MKFDPESDDRGLTLVELIVTIALLGLLATVIAAAITVIFRSEGGVARLTAESHDTQQVVSYLPLDVESGPSRASAYRATSGGQPGDRGSGCADVGNDNILRIDITDRRLDLVDRRVAYQLITSGTTARIDRFVCEFDGSNWNSVSEVNVADALDTSASPIASATVRVSNPAAAPTDQQVVAVDLAYAQAGTTESVTAAPREEKPLSTSGLCGTDPLSATRNIDTFVEGDVHLNGTAVKSALFIGGALSFEGNPEVAQASPNPPDLGTGSPFNNTGLMAGTVAWSSSSQRLRVRAGMDVVIQDNGYGASSLPSGPVSQSGSQPEIQLMGSGGSVIPGVGTELPVPAGAAFIKLRACSDRLAQLPDSCNNGGCSDHVALPPGYPGTAAAPGPQLALGLTVGVANVFNIDEVNLLNLQNIQLNVGSSTISQTTPLVINVGSAVGGTINFKPPTIAGSGSTAIHVIWNFPNAKFVNLTGGGGDQLRGTIMAPYSRVTSTITIEGGVIANSFIMSGPSLNDVRSFYGVFGW